MRIGVIGASGLVGQTFLKLLEETPGFPVKELRLFSRTEKTLSFSGSALKSQKISEEGFKGLDFCFFSAGEEVSRTWAKQAIQQGATVIDNSSAFRSDPDKPLIVPEINGQLLSLKPQIIANPNCSTIQLSLALYAIHKSFGLKTVQVTSLQSISGAGRKALNQLKQESLEILQGHRTYEQDEISYSFNCIPFIGPFQENGFCQEEIKIMRESRKILDLSGLHISAFTVRVPSLNGHSQVVRFSPNAPIESKRQLMEALSAYVKVLDLKPLDQIGEKEGGDSSPTLNVPHARMASSKREVFAGRIHQDVDKNFWYLWLSADNLLKGAALNGLQIAEKLYSLTQAT